MSLYHKILQDFKKEFWMHATLGIIFSSCLGAAAAMAVLMEGNDLVQMTQLFLLVVVCMGFNATVLADLKPKVVFNWLLSSILVSTLIIILHIV